MPSKNTTELCAVDGCNRLAVTRGWCQAHYRRWQLGKDMAKPLQPYTSTVGMCSVDGCDQPVRRRGYCNSHYLRLIRHGDVYGSARRTLRQRFEEKVQVHESGCWLWVGGLSSGGRGRFRGVGKSMDAHRSAFEIYRGPIPHGLLVCHTCDNPRCVNPDHLFLGTHHDNMRDMAAKERHGHSILKASDVSEIRMIAELGEMTHSEIAELFGVSRPTVTAAVARRTWRHVE